MLPVKIIFAISWIIIRDGVYAHPQTQPRFIVSRTIVVHTRFLIKLFGVEEVRRVPRVVAFFYEHFTKRHILDVLRYFTIKVGDVTTAAQVVGMVVELHLFIIILVVEITICNPRTCHRPCLCCLQRSIVATELSRQREECELARKFPSAADNVLWTKLTVHIVVIILTIIR